MIFVKLFKTIAIKLPTDFIRLLTQNDVGLS